MRSRFKLIVPGLLVVACAWLIWSRGHGPTAVQRPAAQPAAVAKSPAAAAATNAAIAKAAGNLSASSTNRLAYRLSNTSLTIAQLERDRHAVLLENAFINTAGKMDLKIPSQLKSKGDPGAFIVQANGAVNNAFRAVIAQAGGDVVSYIPNNALLVQMSSGAAAALTGNPLVQAVLPYEPYYKVQSSLLGLAVNQQPLPMGMYLTLGLYAQGAAATIAEIQQLGGIILSEDTSPFGLMVRVRAPQDWVALADLPGVQLVEAAHLKKSANDLSRVSLGVSTDTVTNANYMGLEGRNVLVEVNDTGVDATHPDFSATGTASGGPAGPTRVIADLFGSATDTSGHGTHVAGIIAGNGSESSTINTGTNIPPGSVTNADFRGKAPLADLYSVNFLEPDSYLQEAAALTNALISNNSWVNADDNEYDLSAASYDAAVRDALPGVSGPQPVLFVFAAGDDGVGNDDGTGGSADTIMSPATAKNVITVGSLEQLRNITNIVTALDGTSNAIWQAETSSSFAVAGSSSRGNVGVQTEGPFGRFKPDVVAPGVFVVSTRSQQWDQQAYYNPTNFHAQLFPDVEVISNIMAFDSILVPQNAVGLQIQVLQDSNSPVPFPTNMPIYVSSFGTPDPNDPTTYDFETTNNMVSIPPDNGGTITGIGVLLNGSITYGVTAPTNYPTGIIFDLLQEVITTNDLGNQLEVLSNLNETIGPYYRYESGTSMAAPAVSGVLALMQDYFTNTLHETPSPALLKAMLINGARVTGGYQFAVTNAPNIEGWGEVQLPNSIPLAFTNFAALGTNTPLFFVDQNATNALITGDQRTYLVNVPTAAAQAQQLRVTLAWTDPPGNPAAAIKLVNDLEVVVTNLANGDIYYANNFGMVGPPPVSNVSSSNDVPAFDPINNVKNISIPPTLGTNYSVTVIGEAVNVNAVTTEQTNIVQDFALVISCGDGDNTNGISVTAATPAPLSVGEPLVTFLPSTNGILFDQIAGSSAPWLSTNTLTFSPSATYATNAVFYVGQTNQWHFYVVTNTFAATNSAFTNAAFIVFESDTLAIPREGVFANSDANSTRPEGELGLFVSSEGPPGGGDPSASSLTNLNPLVLSNCLFGVNGDGASYGRGGTQFVAFTNSAGNQIYYLGVQSEDQTAAQFGIIPIFSATPFSTLGSNGDEYVTGIGVPVTIPVGNNAHPGSAYVVGLALTPATIKRIIVTNTFNDQNFGDLIGSVSHSGQFATLNNHDGFGVVTPATPFIYDDSGQGDIGGAMHSDGPGTLNNFVGGEGIGPWLLTEVDDGSIENGTINSFNTVIEPHHDLNHTFITVSVPPLTWFYDYIDAGVGDTNLLVLATNLPPTITPPIQLFVNEGSVPTLDATNFRTALTNSPLGPYPDSYPGNTISVGPPLAPDRYFIGIYNSSTVSTATVELGAILSFDASAISTVDYDSIQHGLPPAPILLPDDAVTNNTIVVTNTDVIQEFKVGLRVDHPRISDLSFTLIDPNNNRYLLMENRGGQSTNGCGVTVVTTNSIDVNASGTNGSSTNVFFIGQTRGIFPISYNFFTVPDEMTVYYGSNVVSANVIYDTGLVSGSSNITVSFPPSPAAPLSQYLTVVMNQFGNNATNGDLWTYSAGGILTNNIYLTFTEDTNFTTTPIKFAPPPFVPFSATNVVIVTNIVSVTNITFVPTNSVVSAFDTAPAGDYPTGGTVDGWNVVSNQVSVVTDPTNAQSGSQFLTLANGSISRTLATTPGSTNTLTFTYRGPGIAAWWRGENNANDNSGNGNNGTVIGGVNYVPGEVSNAFNFDGTSGHISVPASSSLNVGAGGGITIDCWAKPNYPEFGACPMVEWDSSTNDGVDFWVETTHKLSAALYDTGHVLYIMGSGPDTITNNVFQHLAVTYSKSTGMGYLYINGVPVVAQNLGSFTPETAFPLNLGARTAPVTGNGDLYQGLLDEVSIYNRALSASEIKAIAGVGAVGKFDHTNAPPQNLAEAQFVLTGVTNIMMLGVNTAWRTNTITFVATNSATPIQISGLEPGMLLDSFNLGGFLTMTNITVTTNVVTNVVVSANNLYYQPEVPLTPIIGTRALGDWQLEVLDSRAGATNPTPVLVDWQLEFEFANTNLPVTPIGIGNGPQTNVVGPNSIEWYQVQVPINALAATNSLLFASLPVNFWYSINVPPSITRQNDQELLLNSINGTYPINTTTTTPVLAPGTTYYLGVQNTNNIAVTNVVQVTFLFGPSVPILPTIPTQVVAGGSTLVVANMATDTNAGAVLVYTLVNPPAVATIDGIGTITWLVPTNIAPTNVVITTIAMDTFTGLSATNSFVVVVLPGLGNNQPQTNVVAANGISWFVVQVPTNAIGASNDLLFATLPVNLWFSVNKPPSITNANDFELLLNTTNGSSVLGPDTSPFIVPGSTYYLGVQNTNTVPVTNALEVTFLYPATPPVLPNIPTQVVAGGDTLIVTNMATDTNAGAVLVYTLVNPPAGATIDTLGTITWPTTTNLIGTNVLFTTVVTDTFTGLSATNTFDALVLSGLLNGQPQTNTVATNGILWYVVNVPLNALAATNTLLSSTAPVNLWYSTNLPPSVTNPNDLELLANQTTGAYVIGTNTTPLLVPGTTYYLGVQNPSSTLTVTSAVEVTFEIGLVPPVLPSIPTQIISGGDTLTVTNTATDINSNATLTYTLVNPPAGATIDTNGIITWPTTPAIAPTNVVFTTIALDSYGLSATNSFDVIVLPGLSGGQPQTNVVGTNSVEWYRVVVPSNASAATNTLVFASLPVNLWYSVNVPPTITNSGDIDLLSDVTIGTNILTAATTPKLVPGGVYYLGVENTNAVPVTNIVEVTFQLIPPPSLGTVTATNIGGTNGYLITWTAPAGDQFHLQWSSLLAPTTWQDFLGVISFSSFVTATNSQFSYFDNGTQTGGFGPTRFYRLQLLNSPTNTAPFLVNGTSPNVVISPLTTLTVPNPAVDYDVPAQVLTYTLTDNLTGPDVPELDPTSGTITWTPDQAQANTTNQFTLVVTDNGVPAKSATNTFTVVVTGAPSFSSIQVSTNGVSLQWLAPSNDEFQVRWTTNLAVVPINWSVYPDFITSTNSTFNFTDTNTLDIMKFYQLILVP